MTSQPGYGSFVYDNNGNPTTWRGTSGLTYDGASRLLTYNTLLTAKYRGDGLRGWKQQGTNTGTRTYFLYDGTEPVVELDSAGNAKAYNTFGAYGLVSRTTVSTGASVFYLFDGNGNVAHRLNSSEAVLSSDVYDGYGNQKQGNTTDPFGYEGQYGYYRDSETGLYLCGFRYYDPVSARFVTRDRLIIKEGSTYMDMLGVTQ